VIEVSYDRFNGGRFRHGTSLLRWRPDKAPAQCTMDQLKQKRAIWTASCHNARVAMPPDRQHGDESL